MVIIVGFTPYRMRKAREKFETHFMNCSGSMPNRCCWQVFWYWLKEGIK